jgi:ParB family chromosome partitioning protein
MSESTKKQVTHSPKKARLGRGLGSLLGDNSSQNDNHQDDLADPQSNSFGPNVLAPKKDVAVNPIAVVSTPVEVIREKIVHVEAKIPDEARIWKIAIDKIEANQYQPRQKFDSEKIKELSSSIREKGILQPIVVRRKGENSFELIAGERRWRAAQQAGLHEVPAIIREAVDQDSLELALIENIQRQDLNAIEEAEAYQRMVNEFHLTQAEIAQKVGKDRATVANTLRLLGLDPEVRTMLIQNIISAGHAKALLAITDPKKQREIAKKITSEKLNVRATEKLIGRSQRDSQQEEGLDLNISARLVQGIADDLQKLLGTKVVIDYKNAKGRIVLHYYSDDQLTELTDKMKDSWRQV